MRMEGREWRTTILCLVLGKEASVVTSEGAEIWAGEVHTHSIRSGAFEQVSGEDTIGTSNGNLLKAGNIANLSSDITTYSDEDWVVEEVWFRSSNGCKHWLHISGIFGNCF